MNVDKKIKEINYKMKNTLKVMAFVSLGFLFLLDKVIYCLVVEYIY